MVTFHRENFAISQFVRWSRKKQLLLQPKFQRRRAWNNDARSYLVDTIVRSLPMPKVYLRKTVNPKTDLMVYEVVDGQQRLAAILDFVDNTLVLSKRHNPLGDTTFQGLPEPTQSDFLEYEISTEVMEDATDSDVWAMFERLNTYTLTLNRQEKLNAEYFGYFKSTAYRLAAEKSALEAWKTMNVFRDIQIARMKEVELTSDVLVAIIRGIADITEIRPAYRDFDKEFPRQDEAAASFREALSHVCGELSDAVRTTRFHNRAWFYSLMVAAADAMSGIPEGRGPAKLRPGREARRRMFDLDHALKLFDVDLDVTTEPVLLPRGLSELHQALSRGTSHAPARKTRHDHFFAMLTLTEPSWRDRWNKLTSPT